MRKSKTHPLPVAAVLGPAIVNIKTEFLTSPIPRARVAQISTTRLGEFEEALRGGTDGRVSIILGRRTGVEFAHEGFEWERGTKGENRQGAHEDDDGEETDAALAD